MSLEKDRLYAATFIFKNSFFDSLEEELKVGDEDVVGIHGEEAYQIDFSNVFRSKPSTLAVFQSNVELINVAE